MFRCPKCKAPLIRKGVTYTCVNHHCYDCAKSGYVNLSMSQKKLRGDDKMMIQARSRFLSHGYYEPLQKTLMTELCKIRPFFLIDAGCGQGYYTNAMAEHLPDCEIYGFDLSKFALKTAAKGNGNVHYAVASVAQMPLPDACADGIVSIFAPLYEQEMNRLLKLGGEIIRIGPGPYHLWELKQALYDQVYKNNAPTPLSSFMLRKEIMVDYSVAIVDPQDLQALFLMTPYVYRTARNKAEQLKERQFDTMRLQFHMEIWQK